MSEHQTIRNPSANGGSATPAPTTDGNAQSKEVEKNRQVMREATRLAGLTPGEWRLWIDRSAEELDVPRATLEELVLEAVKDREKKERESKAKARRIEQRAERTRREYEKSLKAVAKLPRALHETKLSIVAERFSESVDKTLAEHRRRVPDTNFDM